MCFQMGALGVHLAAAIEVAAVHPPPAVRRGVLTTGAAHLVRALAHASPRLGGHVQLRLGHPPGGHVAADLVCSLRRGRRRADDRGAQVARAGHGRAKRVGDEAVRGRELLRAVRGLAAGVRVQAVGLGEGAVLIVVLGEVGDGSSRLALVPTGQD